MFKHSLLLAALVSASTAASVQALPVCYMEMHGQMVDLSSMCGNGTSSSPTIAEVFSTEPDYTQADTYEFEPAIEEEPVTFQVTRAKIDGGSTRIRGLVVFPPTSEMGDRVRAEVYDRASDAVIASVTAERTYGQRRVDIDTTVESKYYLRNLEGRISQ